MAIDVCWTFRTSAVLGSYISCEGDQVSSKIKCTNPGLCSVPASRINKKPERGDAGNVVDFRIFIALGSYIFNRGVL